MSRRVRPTGFTLIEVVVAAVLVALLAAVSVPQLIDFIDKQRAENTANMLTAVGLGVSNYASKILTAGANTNTYPLHLSQLSQVIVANTTRTSCGSTHALINAAAVTLWNTNGPFVQYYITTNGFQTPIGVFNDSMVRNPLTTATAGTLTLVAPGITRDDAVNLDLILDGGNGSAAGMVQWSAGGGTIDTVTLQYIMPIGAKC